MRTITPEQVPGTAVDPHSLRIGRFAFTGLRARMLRGVSWNLVGSVSVQGSTFLVNIVLANLWGTQLFGRYAVVQSTVATVVYVAQLGTSYAATRQLAESRASDPAQAGRMLGLCAAASAVIGIVAALGMLVAAPLVATRALGEPGLAGPLLVGALVLAPAIMNGFMSAALAGLEGYPALGRAGIVVGIVYVVACFVGAWLGSLTGAIIGVAVSALLQSLILARALSGEARRQGLRFRWSEVSHEMPVLLKFALPATVSGGISLPTLWLANAIVVTQPGGYDQMALFAAANSFRVACLFVPSMVNAVGISLMSHQLGADDPVGYRKVYWANIALSGAIVVGACVALILSGRMMLRLFGDEFVRGYPALVVLMFAAAVETICVAAAQPLQRRDRMWKLLFSVVVPCHAVLIAVASWLAPLHGARGVAVAYAAGWTVGLIGTAVAVARLGIWKSHDRPA